MNKQENNTQHTIYVNQEELEQIRNFSKKVNQEPTFAKGFADRLKEKFKINVAFISLATALAVVSIPAINSNLSNNGIDLVQTAYAEQIVQNPVLEETESKSNDIIKIGDAVYSTAFDAVKGINHLNANEWFNDTPIDVYNTEQREFMNLNVQELNNMELLSTLAQDSNNVMLFGKSLNEPSGFVPLNEVIDKLIQNNEIDFTQLNNNEYAIQPNAQGGYDLILGGVGLGGTECVNLINELKENGIIPQDAEVTPYIDGGHNVPRINENAQRFTDERLETNYEMAHDPNAEIGLSQSEDEHHKTR